MNAITNQYRMYSQEDKLTAYIQLVGAATELLEQLTEYVGDHGGVAPDDVNETHVAIMAEIVKRLNATKRLAAI